MTVTHSLADCSVVELRRYRLKPDHRSVLVDVFQRHMIEAQEQAGMVIAGLFEDESEPDAFVWMRGFASHPLRTAALEAFYEGPVWAKDRDVANSTMLDSDDVLMLRASAPEHAPPPAVARGEHDGPASAERVYLEVLELPGGGAGQQAETWLATKAASHLSSVMGCRVLMWRSDPTPNGFPRLPVRSGVHVVWMVVFEGAAERAAGMRRLEADGATADIERRVDVRRSMLLKPTARSAHPRVERLPG